MDTRVGDERAVESALYIAVGEPYAVAERTVEGGEDRAVDGGEELVVDGGEGRVVDGTRVSDGGATRAMRGAVLDWS